MGRLHLPDGSHLRLIGLSDAEELHALIEAERHRLARWLPWAEAQTFEDTAGFIRRTREQLAANDGFQLAVVCEAQIGGVVGFHRIDWSNRATSLGYWLGEAWQGDGRMTRLFACSPSTRSRFGS